MTPWDIALNLVLGVATYWMGYNKGRAIGRDEGWNERELDRIAEDYRHNYARRDRGGKFKEVNRD